MKTILEYLQSTDQNFIAPCNGQKICGKCKIKIINRFIEINADDQRLLTKEEIEAGYRLACSHSYQENDQYILPVHEGVIEDNIYLEETIKAVKPVNGIGVIVDIGTTTVAIKKINLLNGEVVTSKSFFNPQAKFGSDVIARIEYDNNDLGNRLGELIINAIFN